MSYINAGYKVGSFTSPYLYEIKELIKVNNSPISDEDFENAYAQIEPLAEEKAETFERFNVVERVMQDLGLVCAYDMPSFWCNKGKDYKVIPTKYHKGYMQALEDVEKDIRLRFGFAERDNLVSIPFDGFFKAEEGET